ncbi:hypothetical protein F8388_016953 [Cannabis sativa]|uniref:alcohol dehydrogenase n=1 Tax=Cannabis sativa TaxID=3483 RepID=A0A7J6E3Y2_CANSA|nr:hypothetical protein F8388_016953 [Cannabis sativa]
MENGNHHHQPINGNGNGYCVNKHLIKTKGELITCKAAVVHGPGEPFVLEEILVEPPQKMEVRIKILFTSICHTDLSAWKGENESQRAFPRILGHEASGVVESVGEGVSDFEKGDHVVPIFNGECGDCECCSNHLSSNKCSKFGVDPNMKVMVGDGRSRFWSKDGTKQIYHFLNTSTFAEYSVLNSACLVKIDSKFSPHLKKMTLLSCGVSTAVGLAVAEGARARGASKIIGVDINPTKFSTGKAMGVTDFINPTELEKPVHQGWGLTVILGIHPSPRMLPIHPMELFDGRSITASVFGGFKGKTQLPIFAQQCIQGINGDGDNKTTGKVITCRGAVAYGPGEPLVVEEILVEPPQKMEVRIKIMFTSICHTDLSVWKGENESQGAYPRILGHEASGYGVNPMMKVMESDGRTRFWTKDGNPIFHFLNTSTFSEYSVVHSACVVKLPSQLLSSPSDFKKITLLSCGVSTGEAMGMTDFVNPIELEKPLHEKIREISGGGVDFSFECAGNLDVLREAYLSTHEGWGMTVVLGIHPSPRMLPIHPMELFDGRGICASIFGGFKAKTQLPIFAQQCIHGEVNLDEFITHELPFEKINEAFQLLIQGKSLRCLLHF